MKLLQEFKELTQAEELSFTLRNKGIMTFVSSTGSINIPMSRGGASHVGVWVVFPNQYEDAIKLLDNKNHDVKFPLSLEEIEKIEKQQTKYPNKIFTKFILIGLFIILAFLVGLIIFK